MGVDPVTIDVVEGAVHGAALIAWSKRTPPARELVDRARVEEPGAVAAEMVRAQRVRDVDDHVHSRADCRDGAARAS